MNWLIRLITFSSYFQNIENIQILQKINIIIILLSLTFQKNPIKIHKLNLMKYNKYFKLKNLVLEWLWINYRIKQKIYRKRGRKIIRIWINFSNFLTNLLLHMEKIYNYTEMYIRNFNQINFTWIYTRLFIWIIWKIQN